MLRAVDVLSGIGLLRKNKKSPDLESKVVRRILVVEPKNIGDVVLTLPFLRQLRRLFVGANISLLANPFARQILAGTDLVDEFIETDLGWSEKATKYNPLAYHWHELYRLNRELRSRNFDLAFKCCMHIREHVVMGISGARRTVGYAFGVGDSVLTDAVPVRDPDRHKVQDWLHLLDSFGGVVAEPSPTLTVSDVERRRVDDFLAAKGFAADAEIVGIHPGASVPEKRWPLERFADVARELRSDGHRVLAFVDPAGYGAQLREIEGVFTAQVGLRDLIALIERCRLLVCNDSGPMHLAGALGVPTIAVFGTGINRWFAPLGAGHTIISAGNLADDSQNGVVPYDIAAVPTSRVLQAVRASLAGTDNGAHRRERTDSRANERDDRP